MSSGLLQAGGKKKPDYGAQIGVPGSVSNWDSSSTLQVELRTRAPSVYWWCTLDQYVFSWSESHPLISSDGTLMISDFRLGRSKMEIGCYNHKLKTNRCEIRTLLIPPHVFCLICVLCHNFWTNYDLDLFSPSKWWSESQFCERYHSQFMLWFWS